MTGDVSPNSIMLGNNLTRDTVTHLTGIERKVQHDSDESPTGAQDCNCGASWRSSYSGNACRDLPTTAARDSDEARRNSAKPHSFDELPVGSVRSLGWIRGEMQKQAAGITGNLTSLYAPFTGTAWAADETSSKSLWVPWEVRAYWCDGAIRCGILLDDADLIAKATELLQVTFSHPQANGYLGPAFLKTPGAYHRWPHTVFFRAAMAWYDSTQDKAVIEKMTRHYLGSAYLFNGFREQTNIEPMLWLYKKTGNGHLLELAEMTWKLSQERSSKLPRE